MTTKTSNTDMGAALAAGCVLMVGAKFAQAWALMLALGGTHTAIHQVPAVSYWTSFAVMVAANMVASFLRRIFGSRASD